MLYKNVRKGLASFPKLYPVDTPITTIVDTKSDYYESLYYYNDEQKKLVEANNSTANIKDVVTDRIYFDFDSKNNVEKARLDSVECCHRLIELGFPEGSIRASYSGMKGFGIEARVDTLMTPDQFRNTVFDISKGLETFDTSINDHTRVIRVPTTKHQSSGMYKTILSLYDLDSLTVDQIKDRAESVSEYIETKIIPLPKTIILKEPKKKEVIKSDDAMEMDYSSIDFSQCPRHWRKYKYALLQGYFDSGERHQALMIIAATCRGMGYNKEQTYYLCKSAIKAQATRSGQEEFSKDELFKNVIEKSVFSSNWTGGVYSPETNKWLEEYCKRIGLKQESDIDDQPCISVGDVGDGFQKYSQEFEKNIIKTGIKRLDDNCMFLSNTHNGVLGQPGSGKTTTALNFLKAASDNNVNSIFLSLDMSSQIIYSKFIQQELGCGFKEAINIYKNNPKKANEVDAKIREKYKNVGFNFRAGLTISDIRHIVKDHEQKSGQKVRLLVTDYLECLAAPMTDGNAAQGYITNQLKDLASELELCSLMLLQTQKHSTPDVSDPLLSMKQVKGSSVLEQSMSVIMTLWREGYNPKTMDNDKYISFAVVKNRFGGLWTGDFGWSGQRGLITELNEEQHGDLKTLRQEKAMNRAKAESGWR